MKRCSKHKAKNVKLVARLTPVETLGGRSTTTILAVRGKTVVENVSEVFFVKAVTPLLERFEIMWLH
jgi:hypothetical protein